MESIIILVGFLGAGKTTLLRRLIETLATESRPPYVILNDYLNADLDAQRLAADGLAGPVNALTGSCICCDGIGELRSAVNAIPERDRGITLIEANGTTDAAMLMGFLGVGLDERFLPPVQVSVVDVRNWQQRGIHNELEAEQVKVASVVLLTHLDGVAAERIAEVKDSVRTLNPLAPIESHAELGTVLSPSLKPVAGAGSTLEHEKTHWSSCSVDLPDLPDAACIGAICNALPSTVLRIKGCTRVGNDEGYTYFERCPDGQVYLRPYRGSPVTGAKLLAVGPGSDPQLLRDAVAAGLGAVARH